MWSDRRLIDLFQIELPILLAPMAGSMDVELAIAVAKAGGLGSLPCAMLDAAKAREQMKEFRTHSQAKVNLNFFCHTPPELSNAREARWRERLAPYYRELGIDPAAPVPTSMRLPFNEAFCALVEEMNPGVVSFHFGLPEESLLKRVQAAGCAVVSSATTVAEARWLEAKGTDAVIAQGFEAGGHRGSFSGSPGAGMVGTMALVPQIADAVRLPVIASGGIADGRGLAAAFALGASGAQLGTAFLGCPEATISPLYRARLRSAVDDGTELTRAFTGRPARALLNRYITEMADSEPLEFPLQGSLVGPLWQLPSEEARTAFMPVWAGQAASLIRELPAGQLVDELVRQAQSILGASA